VNHTSRSVRRRALSLLVAALLGVLFGCANGPVRDDAADTAGLPASGSIELDDRSMPPWPAPTDASALIASAGLDLGPMGTAEHYHPHLRIIIGDQEVPVPSNIGVDQTTGAMSAVHTHEADGTIHVEADTEGDTFTLGQVFTQWGVQLTPTQIGGVKAKAGERVTVTSNGSQFDGDPRELRLAPDQSIVLQLP
jgi:hypothetical protein